MVVLGGDVSGCVIELGANWIRAGYSGEDYPRVVMPGFIGVVDSLQENQKKIYYVGDLAVSYPRPRMNIKQVLGDDAIVTEELVAIFEYIFATLRIDSTKMPILLIEPPYLGREAREKVVDLLFSNFNIPAVYVTVSSVMASFSQGKPSSVVVDVGGSHTSVSVVVDGYVMKMATFFQKIGGNLLTNQSLMMLQEMDIQVRSHYEIKNKTAVPPRKAPSFERQEWSESVSESFKNYARWKVSEDFKELVSQVAEKYDPVELSYRLAKSYEFPDGYNTSFSSERYRVPEILFNPKEFIMNNIDGFLGSSLHPGDAVVGVQDMLKKAIEQVETDLKPLLCNNIILCGGVASTPGLQERLYSEISSCLPACRFKIQMPSGVNEKKFPSWIGGSIFSSLCSFQQLWVSKGEYAEGGLALVEKRCLL